MHDNWGSPTGNGKILLSWILLCGMKKKSRGMISPIKVGQDLFTGYFMKVKVLIWPCSSTWVSLIRHQEKWCMKRGSDRKAKFRGHGG